MNKFFKEFRDFAVQGNVMDMAVGVVVGGAFKGIVDSLVNDILNPIIGLFAAKDLSKYALKINDDLSINYGSFISAVINFIIMAFVIFLLVKGVNKMREGIHLPGQEEEAPAAPTEKVCPYCGNKIPITATRCGFCTSKLDGYNGPQ